MNLPALPVLHAGLRKITERLAHELAEPTAAAPDWSDFEWQLAKAVAAMHGVSPLLATNLQWDGPPGWKSFLTTQREHVAGRHRRIVELLDRLDTRAREEGIALVGLKGTALHRLGFYRAGERPMADIDLLVHPEQSESAAEVLESLGYSVAPTLEMWKHKLFMPKRHEVHNSMGEHSQNFLKIELHERIAEALPLSRHDVTPSVYPRSPHPGLNGYPSTAALLTHLLIHAAGAMAYRALRLMHLHDIALVAARMSEADWTELLGSRSLKWWAFPPLILVNRYYKAAVPISLLAVLSDRCKWHLRRAASQQTLSDVSLSYLWIEAFPGITWSQSLSEAAQCIKSRVMPDATLRRLRKAAAQSEVAVANSEWGHLSQRQRILRWLLSRRARPYTMHAVQSAFND